jgi:peptidoglycan/LPS O-acetylase OafA/YrhL
MAPTERKRRAAGLDGLRGIAALSVFAVHIWIYTAPSRPARDGFFDLFIFEVRLSVIMFFVLSGFLLFRDFARTAVRRDAAVDVSGYARRRLARILPAYYLAMAAAVALLWGAGDVAGVRLVDDGELALFALFAQNYSSETLVRFNPVTWTLCLEVAFYTLLPFLGLLAYRLGSARRIVVLLAGAVALGIGWNVLVHLAGWSTVAAKALPAYLPYFAFGMMLALLVEHRAARGAPAQPLGPLAAAALVAGGFALVALDGYWHATSKAPGESLAIGVFHDLPAGVGFAAVIAAAYLGTGAGVAWLRLRPFAFVGIVSYGFYLWHVPLILFTKRLGLLPEQFLPAAAVTLPVSLAVATLSWKLVEKPMIARAARATRRERPPVAAARRQLEAHAAP